MQPNGNAIVDTICRTAEHGDVTIIFDMTDHHDKDGNVTHHAQLLDVTPERNTNTFANMTK
ncbi:hypothetical protein CIP107546_00252 [Corynebacterium diphtheriae]|nr:hypothetical protein CIP107546_00252 [Corynebacterium diphtheriae]